MKNYRIRYVIRDGESEYGDEIIEQYKGMNNLTAIRLIALHWVSGSSAGEADEFCHKLLEDDFAMIPGDTRAIQDVSWEELQPIIVTIREGLVEGITHLPAGVCIEVHDFDNGETDANDEPIATISSWNGPL